ncbi:NF038104 family lipoprotein [Pseudoteredinibacter isoporae]|uniref:NF038104 family lipoprotein n=1 Tax=Pseudoteredinibacter isoporae TaxID=570281 RepID=UPI003105E858
MILTPSRLFLLALFLSNISLMQGCTVVAIADAAASTVIGVGKVAVKGTVAVVDAAIPDGDDEDDDDQEEEEENAEEQSD